MQTVLGANGQIAEELARELKLSYTSQIRLVSRNPKKVNHTDELFAANLLDATKTEEAIKGSDIAYFTLGLPMDTVMWEQQFPIIIRNIIAACRKYGTKLVFFDNTYMYPQDGRVLTESSPFEPVGKKGAVRKDIASMLLSSMDAGEINAVICRAPEFYGVGKTQSITNTFIFDAIKQNRKLKVPLRDDKLRTLIWTPDASRATALLGNTSSAYGQTWHLPCDEHRLSYKQLIELASEVFEKELRYFVVPKIAFQIGAMFSKKVRELQELLPRYEYDNLFDFSKFTQRFPDFKVTSLKDGITQIRNEQKKL